MARKEQTAEQKAAAKAAAEQEAPRSPAEILADPGMDLTYGEILELEARAAEAGT